MEIKLRFLVVKENRKSVIYKGEKGRSEMLCYESLMPNFKS